MPRARILPALLVLARSMCLASSAEARRRYHGYHGHYGGERYSPRSTLDEWRRMRESGDWQRGRENPRAAPYDERRRERERDDIAPAPAAARGDAALSRGRNGGFGATIDKLVRGCAAQAAEFENWPFDLITQTVGPDEAQRNALTALRNVSNQAAQQLANGCPQEIPAAPAARLEAVEQGIDVTLKAFDVVEPALQAFYGALNDEQKARLYREMASASDRNPPQTSGRREVQDSREYSSRRHRWRDYAAAREAAAREPTPRQTATSQAAAPGWSGAVCEELAAVLRGWPVREIERDVRLSSPQRASFYELVTSSLKAADTLGSACLADAALTPAGRMETMRKRLAAVRAATAAIRPALAHFYEALDQGQKVRFAGMS